MKIHVEQASGSTLIARGDSNHWVVMDTLKKFRGSEAGATPMEVLLMGLGGCTGIDVITILEKMRVHPERFHIDIEAERAPEFPKPFTKIHINYRFWGSNLDSAKINKAVTLSQERYCGASAMLSKTAELTHSVLINPEDDLSQGGDGN